MQRTPPVYALTPDTLASIFQFAVEAGKTARETTNTPLSLSQVCVTWRKSALRHTPLWTNILLGVQGDRSLNRATEFLSRSGTLPVYVTFDMQGLEGETGLKEPVRFLARHASERLRFLRVEGAANAVPVRQFLRILNSTLPNLEEFEIIWGQPTTQLAQRFTYEMDKKTRTLHQLDLYPYYEKLTNLTRLALKAHEHRLSITMDQLLCILDRNHTLESLELEGFHFEFDDMDFYDDDEDKYEYEYEDEDNEKFILELPNLQFLSLKQCQSGALLPRLNIPATTNVVLVANDPFLLECQWRLTTTADITYALSPRPEELSFIGEFETLDFELRDSSITLHAFKPSGQYLLIEQVPDPDHEDLEIKTIEDIASQSAADFALPELGPVTTIKATNLLSGSNRGVLDYYGLRNPWLSDLPHLERLEISYFPLSYLEYFSGDKEKRKPPIPAKDVTLTLYPNECGDFKEIKAWVEARAKAKQPFEKLEIFLDYSAPDTPVDEKVVDSLRTALAKHVKDVVVKVLQSSQ